MISGDYNRDPDPTCAPFEVVPCDVFISEATFALPVYRWTPTATVAADIHAWWAANRERGLASVLFAYALGKAQRVLAELAALSTGPVYVHGAVENLVEAYREAGVAMLPTRMPAATRRADYAGALVVAPPGAAGSPWMRRFGDAAVGDLAETIALLVAGPRRVYASRDDRGASTR